MATQGHFRSSWQSSATCPRHVALEGDRLVAHRQTEAGYDEISCPLPAVITVTAGAIEVRYPTIRGIMAARGKPVERVTLSDLGLEAAQVGQRGARQEVLEVSDSDARPPGRVIVDEGTAEIEIIELLRSIKVI